MVVGNDAGVLLGGAFLVFVVAVIVGKPKGSGALLGQRLGEDGGVGVHPADVVIESLEHIGVLLPLAGGHPDQGDRPLGAVGRRPLRGVLERIRVAAAEVLEEDGQAHPRSEATIHGRFSDPVEEVLRS